MAMDSRHERRRLQREEYPGSVTNSAASSGFAGGSFPPQEARTLGSGLSAWGWDATLPAPIQFGGDRREQRADVRGGASTLRTHFFLEVAQ